MGKKRKVSGPVTVPCVGCDEGVNLDGQLVIVKRYDDRTKQRSEQEYWHLSCRQDRLTKQDGRT